MLVTGEHPRTVATYAAHDIQQDVLTRQRAPAWPPRRSRWRPGPRRTPRSRDGRRAARRVDAVLAANAEDIERAEAAAPANIVDRLRLTPERLEGMAHGLRDVAGLPDPVGEVVRGSTLANGLELRQVRVPFGVVGIIYEARPNVTADAAGICLKSGNAVLLRGSSSARSSNAAIVDVLRDAAAAAGLDADVVQLVPGDSHEPRQGADAGPRPGRRADPARRRRPDPHRGRGVHRAGDRDRRRQLPRVRRPRRRPRQGARDRPQRQDPAHQRLQRRRVAAGARRRRRRRSCRAWSRRSRTPASPSTATTRSRRTTAWSRPPTRTGARSTSRLDISAARRARPRRRDRPHPPLVSQHTDAIVTEDQAAARRFTAEVDSAAVLVNASTRFTDGGRVRLRRRDRHQHPEAARPRPDGPARDDLDQVRRDRRRPCALSRSRPR